MDKILKVTGKGTIRLRPDTICAEITLQGTEKEYAAALAKAQKELEEVKGALAGAGFPEEEIKTSDFRTETKYEGYRDGKGDWKQKFIGYQYTHALKIRFAADNALLGAFISALAGCGAAPVFSFAYTVKNVSQAKEWLLSEAVKDCERKAAVLARAAGVELKAIGSIEYSACEKNFAVRPVQPMRLMAAEASARTNVEIEVTPDDIEVSDTVNVVWVIE